MLVDIKKLIIRLGLVLFWYSSVLSAQKGSDFYLIPGLKLESVSIQEKRMLDSVLTIFHANKNDTLRLQLLDFLSGNCSDELWPRYNDYAYDYALRLLKDSANYSQREVFLIVGAKANARVNYGVFLAGNGKYEEALPYYEEGLKGFRSVHDKLGESNTLSNIATLFSKQGKYQKSLDLHLQTIPLLKEIGNEKALLYTLNSMAGSYRNLGQLEQAIKYLYECLKLEEKNGNTPLLTALHLNLGVIQLQLNETNDAEINFRKCEQIARALNLNGQLVKALVNLAGIYRDQGNFKKSLEMYNQCLYINRSLGDSSGVALTYINLALNYQKSRENKLAEKYFLLSVRLLEQAQDKVRLINSLYNTGRFYNSVSLYHQALPFAQKALNLAKLAGLTENIQQAAELLEEVYAKLGNWKEAYYMSDLASKMHDSIHNNATTKALLKHKIEYEYEKEKLADSINYAKQKEIADLVISEQETQLSKEKFQRYSLLGILFLVVLFSFVLFKNYQEKRKANELILLQKHEVEEKNIENELLLSEIHHRVKNNLQVISSLLSLQERAVTDENAKTAIQDGKERIQSMELVHKLLYQNGKYSGINIHEYIQKLVDGLYKSFGKNITNGKVKIDVPPYILDVDTAIPLGLILNELAVNSLKHFKSETENILMRIALSEKNNTLELEFSDNGNGKASQLENSSSFGMKIVKALVKQLNGQMHIEDKEGLSYSIAITNYKIIPHGH